MFQKINTILIVLVALFSVFSCNSSANNGKSSKVSNDILSVSYFRSAGRGGSEKIVATPDSLIATAMGGMFSDRPNFKKKINAEDWEKIVTSVKVDALKNTKSNETRGQFDGPDEIFEIKTSENQYKLINVEDSENYQQLNALKTILKQLVSSEK